MHNNANNPDPIRNWNERVLDTVRTTKASDAQAARLYAMVNMAMYDAVNGLNAQPGCHVAYTHGLVPPTEAPPQGNPCAAAAAAAHAVLVAAYNGASPALVAQYDQQLQSDLAALPTGSHAEAGQTWGAYVGTQVHLARLHDGSTPNETQPAGAGPGQLPTAWSGVQFRYLQPFGIVDPSLYVGSGPPGLDSLDYAGAFAEVQLLGNAAIADADKLATYRYWSLGSGTWQPPGAWIKVALAVTAGHPLALAEHAHLFALLSMAMADTVAPTIMTKFTYHAWRPATAIQEADTDGNALTVVIPGWAPRAGSTGGSPEYWSGHSSFSAAAATVLAGFFCNDRLAFTLATDPSLGGQERSYVSFAEAAADAGRSRVVGGIHFEFSNQQGLAAGRAVATEILATKLLRQYCPMHSCQCPLPGRDHAPGNATTSVLRDLETTVGNDSAANNDLASAQTGVSRRRVS